MPAKGKPLSKKPVARKQRTSVAEKKKTSSVPSSSAVKKTGKGGGRIVIPVVSPKGTVLEEINAPKELFGIPTNEQLLAQSVRVYLAGQHKGTASTKTRGQVEGSTRKIYRQKGTGRARHGSVRAPIFVGGGIVFGPKPRDFSLKLPKSMKRKALLVALSKQCGQQAVRIVDGFDKLELKTKVFFSSIGNIGCEGSVLVVTGPKTGNIRRALRNIECVDTIAFHSLNVYDVLFHKHVLMTKDAFLALVEKYGQTI